MLTAELEKVTISAETDRAHGVSLTVLRSCDIIEVTNSNLNDSNLNDHEPASAKPF